MIPTNSGLTVKGAIGVSANKSPDAQNICQAKGGVKATSTIMGEFMAARALYTAARDELTKRLPDGITAEQFVVLKMLCAGDVYTDDLAVRSGILSPSLSRMLNDLEAIEAVSRKQCKTDNRRKLVRILKHGKDLVRAAK